MASFDVFVKGIRPERQDESEQIKQKLSQFLKIDAHQLEALWSKTGGGLCVRRDVGSEEAQKIQTILAKAGLICIYKPAIKEISLSLVTDQKPVSTKIFTCPHCQQQTTLEKNQAEPEKCDNCFVDIARYKEHLKAKEEREIIKKRLLNSKTSQMQHDEQQKKEEAERKRKQALEEEIKKEIFGNKKWGVNKKLVIGGSSLAVLMAVGAGYYLYSSWFINGASACGNNLSSSSLTENNTERGNEIGTEGQQSLQDTHDKANKVLGAFGLNADNFARNIRRKNGSLNTNNLISISPSTAPANVTPATLPTQSVENSVTASLLHNGENNQEWDLFLSQKIISLIGRNALADAYLLAQYMVDTEDYINTMNQILASAQQNNQVNLVNDIATAIENRINSLPPPQQVVYLAQAGFYQQRITQKNDLLRRADTILNQIQSPEEQIKSAAKLASYNVKAGNIEIANNYFQQIGNLLEKVNSADQQVSSRAAIARAYFDINNTANAKKWLTSAEPLLLKTSNDTLKELVGSYAYTHSLRTTTILKKNFSQERQAELLYYAIQVALKNNDIDTATAIKEDIQQPTYQALASDLYASYDPSIANYALGYAEKQLPAITLPADKAIIASRLSRHYARLGNMQKAAELTATTDQQFGNLPASTTKDDILALIAKNYAQALQFDTTNNLINAIQSVAVKSSIQNDINSLLKISKLLP